MKPNHSNGPVSAWTIPRVDPSEMGRGRKRLKQMARRQRGRLSASTIPRGEASETHTLVQELCEGTTTASEALTKRVDFIAAQKQGSTKCLSHVLQALCRPVRHAQEVFSPLSLGVCHRMIILNQALCGTPSATRRQAAIELMCKVPTSASKRGSPFRRAISSTASRSIGSFSIDDAAVAAAHVGIMFVRCDVGGATVPRRGAYLLVGVSTQPGRGSQSVTGRHCVGVLQGLLMDSGKHALDGRARVTPCVVSTDAVAACLNLKGIRCYRLMAKTIETAMLVGIPKARAAPCRSHAGQHNKHWHSKARGHHAARISLARLLQASIE